MDLERAFLVICLTIAAVVVFNVILYLAFRRGDEVTTINLLRNAAQRARNPWQDEDDALQELSELVSNLKSVPQKSERNDEQRNGEQG
jgi:hypothetical protein